MQVPMQEAIELQIDYGGYCGFESSKGEEVPVAVYVRLGTQLMH